MQRTVPSQALLQAIVDTAVDGIITIDAEGTVESFNPAAERMFGYSAEEMLGRNVRLLMPPPYAEEHDGFLRRYLETGERRIIGIGREVEGRHKDGSTFPIDLAVAETSTSGKRLFTGVLRDISARKAAENELRHERDFVRSLIDTAQVIVLVLDAEGRILLYNRYMEELCGYALDDVRGQDWFHTFLPAEDRERIHRVFLKSLRGERAQGVENPVITRSGIARLIRWHDTVLRGTDGAITGVLAVGHDITEQKRLETEFLQAQKMEAVGRLASGIAHDFNNLLMGVLGCCRAAARDLEPDSAARSQIEAIRSTVERGGALTRQLLAFSRRDAADPRPVDLNDWIRLSEGMARQLLGDGIRLTLDLDPSGCPVLADPGHLDQVLFNLIVNAADAMPGGGELTLGTHADAARDGAMVVLSVRDTGIGMDAATQAKIFEPFFTTKRSGEGTGLGLSTVYGIVRRIGGSIEVESQPGAGSEFRVRLPRCRDALRPDASADPAARLRGGESVLVVEDQKLVRMTVRQYLEELGYEVEEASDADEALERLERRTRSFDLLLTDMSLPGMQGPELARSAREHAPNLCTLYISAYPAEALRAQGRLAEEDAILEKPFSQQQLAEKVRAVLDD